MQNETAVRVQNVSKTYRIYDKPEHRLVQMATLGRVRRFKEFSALKDVSLEVRRGETVGIVGRNGCGKSTLLQIICGTLQPSGGNVEVNGRVAALLELGAGFNGEFTGRENVYMNGAILGFSREEMDARFDQIAAFAGIGDFIERPVKTYSSGMFVRLAFAVATAVEPDILIVDEALAVGDEAFQRKCFARIEAIKERGGTILFVSHSAQSVIQLCDRAILLDSGAKILEGQPKFVVTHYQRLVNASGADAQIIREEIISADSLESAAPPSTSDAELIQLEAYDPSLSSETVVSYPQNGASITSVELQSPDGRPLNIIEVGRRYRLLVTVAFFEDVSDVGFGFQIRTVAGLALGGAHTHQARSRRLDRISSGTKLQVVFSFVCNVLPGTYFITCGCRGTRFEEPISLHRIVDVLAFRVMDAKQDISNGLTFLEVDAQVVA